MVRWLSRYSCDLDNLGLRQRLLVEEPYEVLVRASYGLYEALTRHTRFLRHLVQFLLHEVSYRILKARYDPRINYEVLRG